MKKNLILGAALVGTASFMMLSGFDSAETAESVLAKYQEASKDLKDTNAHVDVKADLSMALDAETTLDAQAEGGMDMGVTVEPLAAAVEASFSGSAMGMEGSMAIGTYMVTEEDGTITVYSGTDGEWQKVSLPAEYSQSIQDAIANQEAFDAADYPIEFVLADAAVDVNGTECYQLTSTLTWDDLTNLMNWSVEKVKESGMLEQSGEDTEDLNETLDSIGSTMELLGSFVTGVQLNIELDIDTETFYPVKMRMDLDGSDWSTVQLMAASYLGMTDEDGAVMDLNLEVRDLYMEYFFDTASDVVVEVPEDVIASAVEVDASELADAAEELAG